MSQEKINQIVDEATIAPFEQPKDEPKVEIKEEPKLEPKTDTEEGSPEDADVSIDKKFENLKSRLKSEKREMRAQFEQRERQLQEQLAKLQTQQPQPKIVKPVDPNEPHEDDKNPDGSHKYETYGEVLEAKIAYKVEQAQKKQLEQFQQQQTSQKEQAWFQERASVIDKQIDEVAEKIPDFNTVNEDNEEVIQELVKIPHVLKAFLNSENPAIAFYALAKEGKLESLAGMSPEKAAMEIAKAEIRGEAMTKEQPVTKAPQPMKPAKGSGGSGKRPEDLNGDEIRAWLRAK